jgi:hypothetical protein
VSSQHFILCQLIQVAPDGLGRHLKVLDQLVDGDKSAGLDLLENQVLSAPLCHGL